MGKAAPLAFGVAGGFIGGLFTAGSFSGIGFSIGAAIGGGLFPETAKTPRRQAPSVDGVSLPFFGAEYYGTVSQVSPQLIGAAVDKNGNSAAVLTKYKKEGSKGQKTEVEESYLTMALFLGTTHNTGPLYVDLIEIETPDGPKVIYDRNGTTAKKRGFELTPQFRNGVLIAETSDILRLYPGTAQQMPDTALQEWLGRDQVTAFRFSSYMVFNRLPVPSQSAIKCTVRSGITGRRAMVRQRLRAAGIPGHRIQLAHIEGDIEGKAITGPQAPREFAEQVTRWAQCAIAFDGSRVVDTSYQSPAIHEISERDLAARAGGEGDGQTAPVETITRRGSDEVVASVTVNFNDRDLNGDANQAPAQAQNRSGGNAVAIDGAEVSDMTSARRLARIECDRAGAEDREWEGSLMPGACEVLAGDVLRVSTVPTTATGAAAKARRSRDYIVQELEREPSGIIHAKGVPYAPRVLVQPGLTDAGRRLPPSVFVSGSPVGFIAETMPIFDEMLGEAGFIAAACPSIGEQWEPGYIDAADWPRQRLSEPARIGELLEAFPLGDADAYDYTRRLRVRMFYDAPRGTTEAGARAGANLLLLETGRLVSFVSVTQTGLNEWELRGIKDGRFGTEAGAIAATAPVGAKVLLMTDENGERTEAATWIKRDFKYLNQTIEYQFYPASDRDQETKILHRHTGENLQPAAPVALRLSRDEGGGARLTGRGRTRDYDDGAWRLPIAGRATDAPKFEITLSNGVYTQRVRRTTDGAAFDFSFSAGELTALFGSVPQTLQARVAQISDRLGPGRVSDWAG